MVRQIFVNLAVEDLKRTMAFYGALGFGFDPKFTDDNAASMIVGENMYAMLLKREFFQSFLRTTDICDAKKSTEVLVAISVDSREEVDAMVAKAVAAGGTIAREVQDLGFMYAHAFADPDGHVWEPVYMNLGAQG